MKRYCETYIQKDLEKKMVFIGGPRQVGKTTLSKRLLEGCQPPGEYLSWDNDEDRQVIRSKQWPSESPLVVFDELHKLPLWKRWIKGVYDTKLKNQQYLVTGSARLDVYRHGGDSLMGRYHYWRLHPLTLDELPEGISPEEGLKRLLVVGGFPEPFLSNSEREAKRWRKERFDRVLREDIRDLESVKNIHLLEFFTNALRERAGSLITLSNIAQDLEISPTTAKSWLQLVEKMYIAFAIYPLTKGVPRGILKPPKVFFYDNADTLSDSGARLENLVATGLLKRLHFLEDYEGSRCQLHYIRDKEKREVDFATVIDGQLHELIEVKSSDTTLSSALEYYAAKLKPKRAIQIVGDLKRPFEKNGIQVMSPIHYFKNPPWL